MEGDGTELTLEKERLGEKSSSVSTAHSLSAVLKPGKLDECGNNQTNQQITLSPIAVSESTTQESHTSSDIRVTLENESVWSRFHSLGTEMILTKQGRRMFPCCRFRLSGLDPQWKYFLVMDIVSLDDFTHKWNGKTWEPVAVDVSHVPHMLGQICVHPESPALGQQWMDNPVSFYKVKLTSDSIDQEGCVLLRPMHRYQPRLHIVPVDPDSERTILLDSPNAKLFSFPQTEFYAVTSYQNPKITQLKIDCNPFAMAFREDSQSINLLQNKFKLCSSVGTRFQSPLLSFARNLGGKWKEGAVKSTVSTSIQDSRVEGSRSASLKEGEGIFDKMRNDILSCQNNMDLSQEKTDYSESDGESEAVANECPAEPVLDEQAATLDFAPSVTVSIEERLPSTGETVPPISITENLKPSEASEDDAHSQISCTNYESPTNPSMAAQISQTQGEIKSAIVSLPSPPLHNDNQVHEQKPDHPLRNRHYQRGRKAKSKRWSNVKYAKPRPAVVPPNVSLQPDLEDVDGMLFVSFVAKEALNVHAENIKESETSLHLPSSTHDQSDNPETEDASLSMEERIAELEKILLFHLKQLKHRQVIHPCLQDVGMKLSLLDPKLPIDLQYLGVHLSPPPPVHEGLDKMNPMTLSSSLDAAELFVSRTGKTNDPTKIKGWRDKFKTSTVQSAPEGLKNSSAFCSEMLDAYLENEAQQISDRVAVFSKCSASPVSYQLPSKSSSYVVTLDSLLKTRSTLSNKVYRKPADQIMPKSPLRRSPSTAVPLSSAGFQPRLQGNQEKTRKSVRQHAASAVEASRSMSFVSSPGLRTQAGKSQMRWNNNAGSARRSSACHPVIPVKVKNKIMLKEMEEEAVLNGKVRMHITTNRAKFALTSLLNFQKPSKKPRFHIRHKDEDACSEDFCLLGCMCDSLDREIRGPTHCRRAECMFDCNCFKHKVLLLHPPKETIVQRGRKRSVLAFPIADPEREPRPPPAPSVTTLWKRTTEEHDPEPLFIPASQIFSKTLSRSHIGLTHSTCQVREEDKDPVYLYFESMMTCARVREYNSNPPPQIHMFPTKKRMKEPEELNEIAEAGEPPSSQKKTETNPTEAQIKPGEPKPTKLLEILSECNWEPHRSLVLSTLFRRMNSNLLSKPFCFGLYKIQLISTDIKEVNRSSTITYKVCISRADEKEMTKDMPQPAKKALRNPSLDGFVSKVTKVNETHAQKAKTATDFWQMNRTLLEKQQKQPLYKRQLRALHFINAAAGYLKANKKEPGSPPQGLIKVNGKTYNQAKLLLGQLGALHPVNRFAAFVTGRLLPKLRGQPKIEEDPTKACPSKDPLLPSAIPEVANVSNQTSDLAVAKLPEPSTASKNRNSKIGPLNALSNLAGPPPVRTPIVPDGSTFVLVPVIPPISATAPSAETVTNSTLPPGQQVVLQPAPGMPGSKFLCQYNGQMIQLQPISLGPLVQPQPNSVTEGSTSHVMQTAYTTSLPKDIRSLQMPLNSTPLTGMLPNPFSIIPPKVLSLSGKSAMNIANGMPAFNLQSSFPGKKGTFSFRICPPTGKGNPVEAEHSSKPPEPSVDSSSALILPGGFTLIKLFHHAVPAVPAVPTNVTSAASHPAEIPQDDGSMKKSILQSCSASLERNCQVAESVTKTLLPETLNCTSAQAGSNQNNDDFISENVIKDQPVKDVSESVDTVTPGKHDWVPKGAEMVHTGDVSELEPRDMDDWPPTGAERILWIDSADEENEDFNKKLNKNVDVAAGSPATEEASESKTKRNGPVEADFSSSDDCLHADKLCFNENETPEKKNINENGLPPEEDACSQSSHADEQKQHLKSSMPNNDQEKACDPFVNAACSNNANTSKHESPFPVLSSSSNIREIAIQENVPPVLIENEPHNKSVEINMADNEPDLKNQGLQPENSTLRISKIESYNSQTGENTLLDNFHFGSVKNGAVSIKIESCTDSPKADTCFVHDHVAKQDIGTENILPLINEEEPSRNQTVTEFSSDLSKQGLGFECSSQTLNHTEFFNNPTKPNTTASLHAEGSHENIGIAGNAPCSLLDGQTPLMNSPTTEYLLDTACVGQKSSIKKISVFPYNMHKSSHEFSDDFGNLSGDCSKASKIITQDLKEGKDEAEDRNKHLMSKAAMVEVCDDEEITVDVMNLSENEEEYRSDECNMDKNNSSDDCMGDSYSDEEDSSDDSTSDSGTTNDSDLSNEDDVSSESLEENDGKKILNMIKNKTRHKKNAKRAANLRKKIKQLSSIVSTAGYLPMHELEKRQNHTEKERVRRDEMRQSFAALRKSLNIEEEVRMCRHDILNQARIMIWALEDRSQCLEERKKALLQRQTAYLNKIVELSEKAGFEENCKYQKRFGSQKTQQTSKSGPPLNPRRLDSYGNRLPPRFGSWKAPNYIRKRSKKALRQPSVTTTVAGDEKNLHLSPDTPGNHTVSGPLLSCSTENLVRTLIAQNPAGLPPVCKTPQQKSLSTEHKPTEKRSLPKIVLQSFGKTDGVKLTQDIRTSPPSFTEVSNSAERLNDDALDLQNQNKGMEKCFATTAPNEKEHVNKESPTPSSADTESDVQTKTLSEMEKDKQASATVEKVRKKRRKCDVVIEEALSNPDILGPRQLRQRSPAVNGGATSGASANKRRRII